MARAAYYVMYALLLGACALPEVTSYVPQATPAGAQSVEPTPSETMTQAQSSADAGATVSTGGAGGGGTSAEMSGVSAAVDVAGAGGMSSGACACSTASECCDGCMIKPGYCLALGTCYRKGESAPNYDCLYCDPSRAQQKLSPRPASTPCDDGKYCNGGDFCDENGQCSAHDAEPPCDKQTCQSCDETTDSCTASLLQYVDAQAQLVWTIAAPQTWPAASAHCQSLQTCELDDWQLPSIDLLRSVIRGCPATQTGGACRVNDSCLADRCEDGCAGCAAGTGPSTGWYLPAEVVGGSIDVFWSTAVASDHADMAWSLDASSGAIIKQLKTATAATLCVRRVK
ncbi:MAG TPA: DUF1566 domain-containing protein [Polyangiales bacterium]|nr:DUF1566 domain-containing protein [Polyangiales bacterium]